MSERSENELNELEQALKSLTPTSAKLDRDCIIFEAGARSTRRGRPWGNPTATLAAGLLLGILGTRMMTPGPVSLQPEINKGEQAKVPESVPPALDPTSVWHNHQRFVHNDDEQPTTPYHVGEPGPAQHSSSLADFRNEFFADRFQ